MRIKNIERFYELVEKSVIVQGLVTVCLVVTACVMWAQGDEVPQALINWASVMIGIYAGGKLVSARKGGD